MKSHFLETKKNKTTPAKNCSLPTLILYLVNAKMNLYKKKRKKKKSLIIAYIILYLSDVIHLAEWIWKKLILKLSIFFFFKPISVNKKYFYKNEHAWYLINKEAKWKYIKVYRCHYHWNGLIMNGKGINLSSPYLWIKL